MTRPIDLTVASRLLVIAPHPDDESLGCAGLIQRASACGAAVRVLVVTNGENNPWPQRMLERRLIIRDENRAAWGQRRRDEVLAAISLLGLCERDVVFAGLPDQGMTASLLNDANERSPLHAILHREMDAFTPTLIVGPSIADTHPDHSAIAILVRLAISQYPMLPLYEYIIHGHAKGDESHAHVVRLSAEQVAIKRAAILCHRTQTSLSSRRFLAYANDTERFFDARTPFADHPIAAFHQNGDGWQIELRPRRWFDRFSPATVELLACQDGRIISHRQLKPAGRSMNLPTSTLPPTARLFIKRQGGIGFFDEAGWRELQRAPESSKASAV